MPRPQPQDGPATSARVQRREPEQGLWMRVDPIPTRYRPSHQGARTNLPADQHQHFDAIPMKRSIQSQIAAETKPMTPRERLTHYTRLANENPVVAGFKATPDIVLEGWMAIQSRAAKLFKGRRDWTIRNDSETRRNAVPVRVSKTKPRSLLTFASK